MFTGIITDVGTVIAREGGRFSIACHYDVASIAIGASIACDGCCLTVTRLARSPEGSTEFDVDVSNETLAVTTLGRWQPGRRINLERSLGLGQELGGHLVTGHVDGRARIAEIRPDGNSVRYRFEAPRALAGFIAQKGSVALDGTSLTVNEVDDAAFGVALIPHTREVTNWGDRAVGDEVNIEVDLVARYVARLRETERA